MLGFLPDRCSRARLITALESTAQRISLPNEVLGKNPTISPIRQQAMWEFMWGRLQQRSFGLIPIHPTRNNAYNSLADVFKLIHTYFELRAAGDRSHRYFALLALRWMRGESLAKMIEDARKQKEKKAKTKREPSINTIIREVFGTVEKDLRFRYVKYVKCYSDLLAYALEGSGNMHLVQSIPSIPLYLELGACSDTMVSLIGLGLSRTTASLLANKAPRKAMDREQALQWLRRQNLDGLDLPQICIREISRIL